MPRRLLLVMICLTAAVVLAGPVSAAGAKPSSSVASIALVGAPHTKAAAHRRSCSTVRHGRRTRTIRKGHRTVTVRCHLTAKPRAHSKAKTSARRRRILAVAASARRNHEVARAASGTGWTSFSPHVETWAYDDCGNGGSSASASTVRTWVTYAESNCGPGGDTKALSDCHSGTTVFCNVIQYLDTNWIYQNGSPPLQSFAAVASESWYQHVPGSPSTRISTNGYGGGNLINQASPGAQSFFSSYVRSNYNNTDGLMMDDQSPGLSMQLYSSTCHCSATSEASSSSTLRSAHEAMSAAMTHSGGQPFTQIDNSLPPNPYLPQGLDMLDKSGVHGLISEGAPESNGTLDPYYSTLLDEIAYVANNTNSFVVPLSYGQSGASYQEQSRRVQEATMLLGYKPGHLVDWANLEQDSNHLGVWPEEGIYPTQPLQSMGSPSGSGCLAGSGQVCSTGGHNDLQVAPGVYRREFAACYDQASLIGPCATIINTTGGSVRVASSWLSGSYGHQITFSGGDVQSGGAINAAGTGFAPGATTIAAHDATLLTR